MKTRYVKSLPQNAERINRLLKDGFRLYTVHKGIREESMILIFTKEDGKKNERT